MSDNLTRKPAVAGGFYPREPSMLRKEIEKSFIQGYGLYVEEQQPQLAIAGAIVPHAGYTYSGIVASYSYGFLRSRVHPKSIIIIGPNHTGYGTPISVWPKGTWETPLGQLSVDEQISRELLESFPDFDPLSHEFEHSIEVQLPFIQYVYGFDVKIVPVCMLDQSLNTAIRLGDAISRVVSTHPIIILASSDFSHYVTHQQAMRNDSAVIKAILEFNEQKVLDIADKLGVNACGLGPIISTIHALKKLNAKNAQLLKYSTSGEATGDYNNVVGYASVVFY
jgi:AmmeMemoRadiSam system protein B